MLHFRLGAGELLGVQKRGRSVNKNKVHKSNKALYSVLRTTYLDIYRQISYFPAVLLSSNFTLVRVTL
jgi:hypothetical protein